MQLTRWDPIHEIDDLSTRVNRLLGLTRFNGELADWVPACNVMENDKEYRLRVELPDMKKEDIHVKMEDRILVIEGERKEEKEEKGMRFHRRELTYGKFVRRFTMPEEIEASKIQTSFRDGMLELVLPKMKVTLPKV
ncbi:MAG TPA: Hsp20/alpha crystallin family protein, partial [Candidatus Krumholzibacteria bacterium]|nr:Hsp20/alpha crystallin family protein [Candidatus Krumholzibacteria bacterium]